MEPAGILLCWQYRSICLFPQPDQSNPWPPFSFFNINFYIILPSVLMPFKWSLSLGLPHRNPACTSPVLHTCHMPCPSHSSLFDHPNNKYLLRSMNYKAPFMPSPPVPKYLPLHIIAKHPCPPLKWQNKFHVHVKQPTKLQFGMF